LENDVPKSMQRRVTELEEAELTDGQGRALSATQQSYEGYAKRNLPRALESATRTRWRTQRQHLFRMRRVTAFRMKMAEVKEVPDLRG
jgi:hypothetical protein